MPGMSARRPVVATVLATAVATAGTVAVASGALAVPAAPAARAATLPAPATAQAAIRLPVQLSGPERAVAERAFPAGVRMISATVSTAGTGRPTMLTVTLTCGTESVQATTNVITAATLTPRRIMTDPTACQVTARAAVDHPTARDGLTVTATIAASPVSIAATGYSPRAQPGLLRPGKQVDVVPASLTVPDKTDRITATGDLKITACTSTGGSRENGSPALCTAKRVRAAGSTLRVALIAAQRSTTGGYCAVRTLAVRTVHVDRRTHHAMVAVRGSYTLATAPGCTRTVRVKLQVRVVSGADAVIHRRGTIVSVYR
jgi:hypothetical protein